MGLVVSKAAESNPIILSDQPQPRGMLHKADFNPKNKIQTDSNSSNYRMLRAPMACFSTTFVDIKIDNRDSNIRFDPSAYPYLI